MAARSGNRRRPACVRWNAEYQIQLRDYGADRLVGCELRPMRYDAVVQAFGGHLPACLNVIIEGVPAPQIRR